MRSSKSGSVPSFTGRALGLGLTAALGLAVTLALGFAFAFDLASDWGFVSLIPRLVAGPGGLAGEAGDGAALDASRGVPDQLSSSSNRGGVEICTNGRIAGMTRRTSA